MWGFHCSVHHVRVSAQRIDRCVNNRRQGWRRVYLWSYRELNGMELNLKKFQTEVLVKQTIESIFYVTAKVSWVCS